MTVDLGTAVIAFATNTTQLDAGFASVRNGLLGVGAVASAAAIAVGVAAVKMAGDYQAATTTLVTGAGESVKNLDMIRSHMLAMSVDTGTSTDQLVKGMFMIESAGFRGADGLRVLQAAAEGAKVGNADLGTVANAVTTVMKDFGMSAAQSGDAMNFLTAIVQNGKTTMQDLAGSISTILPTASALRVHLTDVGAAMATMTGEGVPAANAATYLRQMLMSLAAPATAGKKALADIGLTTQQVSDEMKKSLPETLKMIMAHLAETYKVGSPQYVEALKAIAGGSKQMQGMLDLTGTHLADFQNNMKNVAGVVNQGKGSIVGWTEVQGDFNFKMDQAKQAVSAVMIGIGTMLLPVLSNLLGKVTPLISAFGNWATSGHAVSDIMAFIHNNAQIVIPVLAGLGAIVAAVLVPAVWSLAAGIIAATWPFLAIGAAVAGVVAIFVHFYQTNAGFKSFIDNLVVGLRIVWGVIQANFIPAMQAIGKVIQTQVWPVLQQVGSFLLSTFTPVWQQLVSLFQGTLVPMFKQLWAAIIPLVPILKMVGGVIATVIIVDIGLLVGVLKGLIQGFANFLGGVITWIGGFVQAITGVFQVVSGIVRFFVDLFTGNFSGLKADLGTIWQGIQNIFMGGINMIKGIFQGLWGWISGFLSGFVTGVIGFFTGLWNKLVGHSIIPDMINGIITWFASLPGRLFSIIGGLVSGVITFFLNLVSRVIALVTTWARYIIDKVLWLKDQAILHIQVFVSGIVSGFLSLVSRVITLVTTWARYIVDKIMWLKDQTINHIQGMVSGITSAITGLISNAFNWGKNFVQGLINGITSMVGNVASAVGNIASTIAGFFPHSPAKEGPLRDLALQGSRIPEQIALGMISGLPKLQAGLSLMLAPHASLTLSGEATRSAGDMGVRSSGGVSSNTGGGDLHILGAITSAIGNVMNQVGTERNLPRIQMSPNPMLAPVSASALPATSGGSTGGTQSGGNGIISMVGNVASAVGNIASTIAGFFPHSPTKEDPLRDLAMQGSRIPEQIALSIERNLPRMQTNLNLALAPVSSRATASASTAGIGAGGSGDLHVHVDLDGQQVGHAVVSLMRLKTGGRA